MSWPYPPRSRSRSPRSRPPYPDSGQDTYRPEFDGYDRDRAWPSYDSRNYEYSRRGRSRSPALEDGGRKRRRSPSPYDRERYDPRPRYVDDYDTHSRGYGGYSPRRGPPLPYPTSRRAPPDPHTFDYPASLKQYAEWFRFFYPQQAIDEDNADKAAEQEAGDGSKPRNGIKSRWEKYKKDFAATQLQTMFDHHRKSPWFAEKYDPASEYQNLRMRVRKEGWKGRFDTFIHDLESGKYDPELNEPEETPVSPVKESLRNGGSMIVENNGAAPAPTEDAGKVAPTGDDEMQFNVDVDEEPVDPEPGRPDATNGKASSDRRNNRGEEVSVLPEGNQVMIRTIPPDIGRVKLEESCGKIPGFVYLALGDPLQKRNYYRAGWLKFRDDADMAVVMSELADKKIEGFKLHVTHNQRPFTNKIRFTPEVASKHERLEKDLANAKSLAAALEDQATKLRHFKPSTVGVKAGGHTDDGTMHHTEDTEEELDSHETGSEAVERRIQKVMSDLSELKAVDVNDDTAYEAKKIVVALDLYLAYMRAAYNACYYCAVVTDHVEELQRKCVKHMRKPLSNLADEETKHLEVEKEKKEEMEDGEGTDKDKEKRKEKERKDSGGGKDKGDWKRGGGGNNDDRWLEWLDSKLALLINRDGVDPRMYSGKSYEEELTKAVEPYLKQEDEGKFRCKTCQKLFKATSFVEKHIANKHPDHVKHLDDIPYFNNFALDPHHIQPFTHPPSTNNSSQAPPPQAYGLQGPPPYHGGDFGRIGPYYGGNVGYPPPGYPPPYQGGHWDPHGYPVAPLANYGITPGYMPPMNTSSRRDESLTARRLSDRISGFAIGMEGSSLPPAVGLPPKPTSALDSALVSGSGSGAGGRRKGGRGDKPPPPPPDAKEDPRAVVGKKVSYHDMDSVAEGDVELCY